MARTIEAEEALILKAIAYGESDRVVTLLGRKEGKVAALAKGARRSKKRFAGGLSLMSLGLASLVDRPGAELARLDGFDARSMWPGVIGDLGKIAHAGYVAELLDALMPPRQADERVFELALSFMRALDAGEARAEALRVFELHLLDRVGLRPELAACVRCGRPADDAPGQRLDPHKGGVTCASCRGDGPLLDGPGRRAMLTALEASFAPLPSWRAEAARGARIATQAILQAHVGREMKSVAFIDKLNQAAQ